ncbi:diguanylate cyclase domain-containing protein [Calditerrivibrio sp.]|jgi:diguanylate cyclase (GGDEF)-like protein|uniref:sensor domain-containing diguanylate cyclase n=1 Tax=Calditerrivibrio sp. TaxID=2792612 RepID=UPI003D09D2F1
MVIDENVLNSIFESCLDAMCAVDKDLKLIFFNTAFKNSLKEFYDYDVKRGSFLDLQLLGIDKDKWFKYLKKAFSGISIKRVFYIKTRYHSNLAIMVKFFPLKNLTNEFTGAVVLFRNISKERKKQKILKNNLMEQYLINEVFKTLFNPKDFTSAVNRVLSIIGNHTRLSVIYVYEDYFDKDYCHLSYIWTRYPEMIDKYEKEFSYKRYEGLKEGLLENNVIIYNKYAFYNNTVSKFFETHEAKSSIVFPMMIKGEYIGFIGFDENDSDRFLTVTEIDILRVFASILTNALIQKYTEEKLKYASTHDPLTGLYNRAYFDAELERYINGRVFPVSIIMADLNGLKQINDTMGHKEGDLLIQKAAKVLLKVFRKEDCVARIGGDEFAIVLPRIDEAKMQLAIERIRQVEMEVNQEGLPHVSFALGGATAMSKDQLQRVLSRADELMYEDKKRIKASLKR